MHQLWYGHRAAARLERLHLYDHQPERKWRHLDTCQYQTILHAEPPRSECRDHGVRAIKLAWAEPSRRFTALFEALAIEWLKAASQKAVAGLIRVDEKAFRKGHSYLTLGNDLIRARVGESASAGALGSVGERQKR